jgi:hypothetical protein
MGNGSGSDLLKATHEHRGQGQSEPYLLLRDLSVTRADQVWCADISYIPMRRGNAYICAVAAPSHASPFTLNPEPPATSKPKASSTSLAVEIEADADTLQRWTAKRKAAIFIDMLQDKTTTAEAARQYALTLAEVEQWKDDFITQGTEALRSHTRDLAQQFEAREKTLLAKVGEHILHVDILTKAHRYQGKDLPEGICQH